MNCLCCFPYNTYGSRNPAVGIGIQTAINKTDSKEMVTSEACITSVEDYPSN